MGRVGQHSFLSFSFCKIYAFSLIKGMCFYLHAFYLYRKIKKISTEEYQVKAEDRLSAFQARESGESFGHFSCPSLTTGLARMIHKDEGVSAVEAVAISDPIHVLNGQREV